MQQLNFFTTDDNQETNAATPPQEIGCVYPCCNKVRAPNSAYCQHHIHVVAWEATEPERRRQHAAQLQQWRSVQEETLAASPLRAMNPQSVEPPQRKRRAKPRRIKLNRGAKFLVEKERIS
jgi:hypothetical protein